MTDSKAAHVLRQPWRSGMSAEDFFMKHRTLVQARFYHDRFRGCYWCNFVQSDVYNWADRTVQALSRCTPAAVTARRTLIIPMPWLPELTGTPASHSIKRRHHLLPSDAPVIDFIGACFRCHTLLLLPPTCLQSRDIKSWSRLVMPLPCTLSSIFFVLLAFSYTVKQ